MPVLDVYTGYVPRAQFEAFHNRVQRWAELICHRRAGKTVAAINDLQERCLAFTPPEGSIGPGRFAFMAPTRVRAKDIAWQYLKRFAQPIPGINISESELFVEYPNGGRVTIYGADNDRGMGLYLDGIVLDECDEIPPSVDAVIEPALSDRKGWTVHMGILRGRHNLFKRFEKYRGNPEHYQVMIRASESKIIPPNELRSLRERIGDSAYELQMECNVNASLANAIYGRQMDQARAENRIKATAFTQENPIDFFFDIGHSLTGDDWAFWGLQFDGRDVIAQTYYCRTGEVPGHYAAKILQFCNRHGLQLGTVFLPHDGERKDRQGRTAVDDLREAQISRIKIVHRTPNLWDSINHLRALLPRFYIDPVRCGSESEWTLGDMDMPSGIDCLDYYSKKEDASTGIIQDVPIHDQYSHGADALRTFAEAERLGMIAGTSHISRENRQDHRKVLRGPSPSSYSIQHKKQRFSGRVLL